MKRLKTILAVAAALASFGTTRALAATPITLESDWTWDMFYTSHTGVTSATDDIAGLGGGVSSTTGNIIGFSWSVLSVGANSSFTVSYPTRTYAAGAVSANGFNNPSPWGLAGAAPAVSTTQVVGVIASFPLAGNFETATMNPVFTWSGLSASATTYLWVTFGRQKFK
jgi:hypothetical protein